MSKRKEVREQIYLDEDRLQGEINKIIEYLQEIRSNYYDEYYELAIDYVDDYPDPIPVLFLWRWETDSEMKKRLEKQKKEKQKKTQNQKEKDKKVFQHLKKKYGDLSKLEDKE